MPNWCMNTMIINGDPKKVAEFVEDHKMTFTDDRGEEVENVLDFNKDVPMPESEKDNWYNWSCENWGTKWNACEASYHFRSEKEVFYNFDTAWSPPVSWFERAVQAYPDLEFEIQWEEGGMAFAGRMGGSNGVAGGIEEWDIIWDEEAGEYEVLR